MKSYTIKLLDKQTDERTDASTIARCKDSGTPAMTI